MYACMYVCMWNIDKNTHRQVLYVLKIYKVYAYIHICTYIYTYTRIHFSIHPSIHPSMHAYLAYLCTYMHTYIFRCPLVQEFVFRVQVNSPKPGMKDQGDQ